MSELAAFAQFVKDFGWLGVTILIVAAFLFGIVHGDKEFSREVARGDKAIEQRDEAIKLAQSLTGLLEGGRRGGR